MELLPETRLQLTVALYNICSGCHIVQLKSTGYIATLWAPKVYITVKRKGLL